MNWLSILDVPNIVGNMIDTTIDRLMPDLNADAKQKRAIKTLKAEMEKDLQNHINEISKGQIESNKIEANGNWWQKSWRPAVAWICILGMGYSYLVQPIGSWIIENCSESITILPIIPSENMTELLIGMLGMASLRGVEKYKHKQLEKGEK